MEGFFTGENAIKICLGAWAILCPVYIVIKKRFEEKTPHVFKTTEYKRKFKKHQIAFNEEFKQSRLFK